MGRRGKRRKIAKGIYQDGSGISGIYRDRFGKQREVRCPPGTSISQVREAVARAKERDRGAGPHAPIRGTLAHAVEKWEPLERHLASWMERRAELRAWVDLYGDRRMNLIMRADVLRAIGLWAEHGVASKTIRNRLWSLRHLYHVLFGPKAPTPCDDVKPPAKTPRVPRFINPYVILAVYDRLIEFEQSGRLRNAKTRARYMVRAATGRRPSEIMRAKPDDLDLERRTWRVRDGKGGWTPGGLYLNDDALTAWRLFAECNAWGPFNTGSQAEVLRHAGWPGNSRPYDMRSSVGIEMSERGIDLQDVGAALGHAAVQTTRSAYVPVLSSRMKRAAEAIEGRLAGWKPR